MTRMCTNRIGAVLAFGVCAIGLTSCATVGGWFGSDGGGGAPETAEAAPEVALSDHEAVLRKLVQRHVDSAGRNPEQVIRRRPYYFKEYSEYPNGVDAGAIAISASESRSIPYRADVTLDKIRYATRLHRTKDAARSDGDFLRDTGMEKIRYEYRSGHWTRVGGLFVADRTDRNQSGAWEVVEERPQPMLPEEQAKQGWFGRRWSSLFRRN